MSKQDRAPTEIYAQRKRIARMNGVDAMPAELRELVHEFGLPVVNVCLELGIRKPNQISIL